MLIILKILIFLSFFYIFGTLLFKVLLKLKFIENYEHTNVIKLLISIIFINNFIIYGFRLDLFVYLLYLSTLFFFIYFFYSKLKSNNNNFLLNKIDSNFYIFFLTLIFMFTKIIIEPVQLWDARSIWFYSGKIIYFNNQYHLENFQNDLCEKCLFLFYPKLIPVLASLISSTIGFWNDYLTKISLFMLLFPSILFLKNEFKSHILFLLSLILLIYSNGFYNWNGYMDGYLTIYTGLTYYCFIKYTEFKDNKYLFLSIIFLALCINLKIESIFLIISLLIFIIISKNFEIIIKIFSKKFFFNILLFLVPSLFWILINFYDVYDFSQEQNKNNLSLLEYLNNIISSNSVLGTRFNNYLTYIMSMTIYESKIIYYFALVLILKILNYYFKFLDLSWNKFFLLQIIPITYLTLVLIFYLKIGYSHGLPSMKDWILASFDRYTLPIKGLLSINILIIFNNIKPNYINYSYKKFNKKF